MKITIQDEFLSNDPDIIVGKTFIEKNTVIRDVLAAEDLYLYYSTTATYAPFENETCKGTSEALVVGRCNFNFPIIVHNSRAIMFFAYSRVIRAHRY